MNLLYVQKPKCIFIPINQQKQSILPAAERKKLAGRLDYDEGEIGLGLNDLATDL